MGGDRKPARKEDGEKREGRSCDGSSEVNLINRKSEKKKIAIQQPREGDNRGNVGHGSRSRKEERVNGRKRTRV